MKMATLLTLLCTFQLHVALVISAISFITDHWAAIEFGNLGLWSYCFLQSCRWFFDGTDILDMERKLPGWFIFTQGLVTLSLLCQVVAVLLSCFNLCKQVRCLVISIITIIILAASLHICALTVFGFWVHQKRDDFLRRLESLSWSYYLSVAALFLLITAAILFIITLYMRKHNNRRRVVTYRRNVSEDKMRSLDDLAIPGYDDMM